MSNVEIKEVKFQYGNYNRYYGYRNQNFTKDPRLSCFESKWFEGQDVLDIGCNVGHVTLTIAKDFNPRKIIGIDIDDKLIKSAKRNVKNYLNSNNHVSKGSLRKRLDIKVVSKYNCDKTDPSESSDAKSPPKIVPSQEKNGKCDLNDKPDAKRDGQIDTNESDLEKVKPVESSNHLNSFDAIESSQSITTSPSSSSTQPNLSTGENLSSQLATSPKRIKLDLCKPVNFPRNVKFFCQNYVLDSDDLLQREKPEFDCILCLSVTKWIHLNFGDDGLKRVFKRMYKQLRPGGKLILEPQPWSSYKKKKIKSEFTLNNFAAIKFKPNDFNEYLLSDEVGFSKSETLKNPEHESKGFQRPIFLYIKEIS